MLTENEILNNNSTQILEVPLQIFQSILIQVCEDAKIERRKNKLC